MRIVDRIDLLRKELEAARAAGASIGWVPTMGALHRGHASLIERSAAECDVTVVTVFVNPLQFGPQEDFTRYPRDLAADADLVEATGADLLFAPSTDEMSTTTRVVVDASLTDRWEGASRPGHFSGVATVVAKLFAIAGPCRAYFGEKDWQQLQVVRRLVADLSFPVDVVGCPTVREEDGLALSSRNRYLSPEERQAATVLYRALTAAAAAPPGTEPDELRRLMRDTVATEPLVCLDYADLSDDGDRLLIAACVGTTRLIDNLARAA